MSLMDMFGLGSGLPPKRAELALLVAQRDALQAELQHLQNGRFDVLQRIADLDQSRHDEEAEADGIKDSILDRIKQGLAWRVAAPVPVADYSRELGILTKSLCALDSEIGAKTSDLDGLQERLTAKSKDAVREVRAAGC
jgi:hypothetical protein